MTTKELRKLEPKELLLWFIKERESIRLKKEAGESKPWCDGFDNPLRRFRFCNVRRMDDSVSQWLYKRWYKPQFNHVNIFLACCLARFINLPSTLEVIGFPHNWEPKKIKFRVRELQEQGIKCYSPAYLIRGNEGKDKIDTVVSYTIQQLVDEPPELDTSSMQACWEALTQYKGFGSFMAGQVVADLRWAMKGTWKDRNDWAPIGPGSQRGMNRIQGRDLNSSIPQEAFVEELQSLRDWLYRRLPAKVKDRLEIMDIQNTLCEADKLSRVVNGEGRPKQLYPGVD